MGRGFGYCATIKRVEENGADKQQCIIEGNLSSTGGDDEPYD